MNKNSMYESIEKNLSDLHWGIKAKGTSPGNHPRFYIMDYRGLALATGIIRYALYNDNAQTHIYYRGQRKDAPESVPKRHYKTTGTVCNGTTQPTNQRPPENT